MFGFLKMLQALKWAGLVIVRNYQRLLSQNRICIFLLQTVYFTQKMELRPVSILQAKKILITVFLMGLQK